MYVSKSAARLWSRKTAQAWTNEQALAKELGVQPIITFAPHGLIYELDTPLAVIAARASRSGSI